MRQIIIFKNNNVEFPQPYTTNWKGLTFTALADSTITYSRYSASSAEYSYDAITWDDFNNKTISLTTGQKVYVRGEVTADQQFGNNQFSNFTAVGNVKVSGDINSLKSKTNWEQWADNKFPYTGAQCCLFRNGGDFTDVKDIIISTKDMNNHEIRSIFEGLPIIDSPDFSNIKKIGAETLCGLFFNCTQLVNGPAIFNVDNVPTYGMVDMFYGCTSLVNAPILNIKTASYDSLRNMFYNCNSLNYVKCYLTGTISNTAVQNWLYRVASPGTFECYPTANYSSGVSGIPSGWTRVDIQD